MSELHLTPVGLNVTVGAIDNGRINVSFEAVGCEPRFFNVDLETADWKKLAGIVLRTVLIAEENAP